MNIDLDNLDKLTDEEQEYLEEPVLGILSKDVTVMSPEELAIHVKTLREMRTGQGGVKQLLSVDAESIRERKPRAKKKKSDVDMSLVW